MSEFGDELRRLLALRDMSLRELGRRSHYDHAYLSRLARGLRQPTREVAAQLDEVLGSDGVLAALLPPEGPLFGCPDGDRLTWSARNPRHIDLVAVENLADVLAAQRRAEDSLGSAAVLPAVTAQLRAVQGLASEARGPVRAAVVDTAGQWAQFAGWLRASTGRLSEADRLYDLALCMATEAGNRDMTATALNMKGFVAWLAHKPGPMIGLSQAAQRDGSASPGVRALAVQQEARGHAIMGDAAMAERKLDEAHALTLTAAGRPEGEPPWVYFFSTDYLKLQRARALLYLGRHAAAADLLAEGLAALPAGVRRSEWSAHYLADLGAVWRVLGDTREAARIAAEVADIAAETGSARLARRASALR